MSHKPSWLLRLQEEDRRLDEEQKINAIAGTMDESDEIDELLFELASSLEADQIDEEIIEVAFETDKRYKASSAARTSFLCSALRGHLEREAKESNALDFFGCLTQFIDTEEHELAKKIGLNELEYRKLLQKKLYPWDIDPEKLKRMYNAFGLKFNELIDSIQATIPEAVMAGSSIARKSSSLDEKDQAKAQEVSDYYLALKRENTKKHRLIESLKIMQNDKRK